MKPKTKLIIYLIISVLLLGILLISFFVNQSIKHPRENNGIYKEPEQLKQTASKTDIHESNIVDKYGCENVTSDYKQTCEILGAVQNNMWYMLPLIIIFFTAIKTIRYKMFIPIIIPLIILMPVIFSAYWLFWFIVPFVIITGLYSITHNMDRNNWD